jgi:hypothetical protein
MFHILHYTVSVRFLQEKSGTGKHKEKDTRKSAGGAVHVETLWPIRSALTVLSDFAIISLKKTLPFPRLLAPQASPAQAMMWNRFAGASE